MEFALHLLPYVLVPPMKRKQRTSMEEAATNFIQIHPVGNFLIHVYNQPCSLNICECLFFALDSSDDFVWMFLFANHYVVNFWYQFKHLQLIVVIQPSHNVKLVTDA